MLALGAATSHASSTTVSPCRQVSQPTWSPDGTQIVYFGKRWPPPTKGHRNPNDILQALCTMNGDGSNVQPLRYTVCSENCPDPPYPIDWLQSGITYLRDAVIYRIAGGSKPHRIARTSAVDFDASADGTRIATDLFYPGCLTCKGPITVYDAQSGAVVGTVGGKKLENIDASLSPDGAKLAFDRYPSTDSGKALGVWTANANGSHLRQLVRTGQHPLWSPTGTKIAYLGGTSPSPVLRVISPGGGKSRTLVAHSVQNVFGWSPDGKYIAFELGTGSTGELAVVNVATRKVKALVRLQFAPSAAWAPDSTELVATSVPKTYKCWSTWRVPIDGSKPTLISTCS